MKKPKAPQKAFEIDMLPSSRKAQFFDLLRHRFFFFVGVGALSLLFSLVLLGGAFMKDACILNINGSAVSEEEKTSYIFAAKLISYGIKGLGFPLLGLGLSGLSAALKNLLWNEPVFIKEDFRSGIKENGGRFAGIGFLWGLLCFAEGFIGLLFSNLPWFEAVIFGINLAFIFPILLTSLWMSLYYANSFGETIQKSAVFYFRHFPLLFLSCLCLFLPFFGEYIPIFVVKYGVLLVWMVLVFPFALLFSLLLHLHYFDEDVNAAQFPSYYQRGLSSFYKKPN